MTLHCLCEQCSPNADTADERLQRKAAAGVGNIFAVQVAENRHKLAVLEKGFPRVGNLNGRIIVACFLVARADEIKRQAVTAKAQR